MNTEIVEIINKINNAGSLQNLINIPSFISSNNIKITFNIIDNYNIKIQFYYGYLFPLYIYNLPHELIKNILSYSKEYIILELNIEFDNNFPYNNHILSVDKIKNNLSYNHNILNYNINKIINEHNKENQTIFNHTIQKNVPSIFSLDKDILWLFFKITSCIYQNEDTSVFRLDKDILWLFYKISSSLR